MSKTNIKVCFEGSVEAVLANRLPLFIGCPYEQGGNKKGQGGRNSPGPESLWGRQITARGVDKS